ncbi:MAG: type II secretion system protein [Kiritimatiellae bacterium]|nr:type II secretion system protein [Kiritimatiellia bacterium]MDD4734482.1 type II secretion system protein [Kiritimatiellia bacterium]
MNSTNNRKPQGFTLVEIMIVVAIIGLLAAIGIPSFMKAREKSLGTSKATNCTQIEGAIARYAMDAGGAEGDTVEWDHIGEYLRQTDIRKYDVGKEQVDTCSLTIGGTVAYKTR